MNVNASLNKNLVSVLSLAQMKNSWGCSQDLAVAACDIMDVITFGKASRNTGSPFEFQEKYVCSLTSGYYLDVLQLKTMI